MVIKTSFFILLYIHVFKKQLELLFFILVIVVSSVFTHYTLVNSGTKLILNQKGMIPHSQGSFKGCVN